MTEKYNFNTYMKDAKLKWEAPSNMADFLMDFNLYNNNKDTWDIKNRDRLHSRAMSYGAGEMQTLPDYADWRKYSGKNDEQLIRDYFGYDKIQKSFEDRGKIIGELSKPISMGITNEKARIGKQKENRDYNREDHFAIGTVYLKIPPTQISISQENHNFRYNSLRSVGETIASSGKATTRIDLDIFFSGYDDINNKLRPLLAQFKTTPFLPIENEYIKAILNPLGKENFPAREIEAREKQLGELKESEKAVNKLIEITSSKANRDVKIIEHLTKMKDAKHINSTVYNKLVQYVSEPQSIPPEETEPEDYKIDINGQSKFDLAHWIKRNVSVGGDYNRMGLGAIEKNINEIGELTNEIEVLKDQSNKLFKDAYDERYTDQQIVGVLSQFSISTVPNFPETLACRISLYVFNYEPFSRNFAFVSGYEGKWTPDITKCDLFIDWYAKRFLSGDRTLEKPGLSEMKGNDEVAIAFITDYHPEDAKTVSGEVITPDEIIINNGIITTGITVSFRNIIQFLPILSHKNPTCQYMGSYNSEIQINMEATSLAKVNELSRMFEKIGIVSRNDNRLSRSNFIAVRNELLDLCGMKFFMINSYNVDTVPGNPGLYSLSLTLSEYKLNTEKLQKLKRKGVVTNKDLQKAAEFVMEKAFLFADNGGKFGESNPYKEYEIYHNLLINSRNGWLSRDTSAIRGFARKTAGAIGARGGIWGNSKEWEKTYELLKSDIQKREIYNKLFPALDPKTARFGYSKREHMRYSGDPLVSQEEIYKYAEYVSDIMQGNHDEVAFKNMFPTVSQILVSSHRNDLISLIREANENQELYNFVKKESEGMDFGKSYCYPDLELPKYSNIPDGLKYKQTYKDNGQIPPEDKKPEESMQSIDVEVDPDFFFYKGHIWRMLDDDPMGELHRSIGLSTKNFMKLISRNKSFRSKESVSEDNFAQVLIDTTETRRIGKETRGKKRSITDTINTVVEKVKKKARDLQEGRYKLEGVPLEVVRVYDGDTFYVMYDGKEQAVRPYGYNAPEKDEPFEDEATKALKQLLEGKTVYLNFEKVMLDDDNRLLAHVKVVDGNSTKNVSAAMISKAHALGLREYQDPKNTLQLYYNDLFFNTHEIWINNLIRVKKGRYEKALDLTERAFSGADMGNAIFLMVSTAMSKTIMGIPEGKLGLKEKAGIALAKFTNLKSKWIETSAKSSEGSVAFKLSASDLITNMLYGETSELGYRRFDRHAKEHIDLITKRIREQQKDDVLRVSRAFPTFKIYFIEEDMQEWGFLNDPYEYNAVQSIDITRSRKEAADVAVITFLNTKGKLDTSRFGLYDKNNKYIKREEKEKVKLSVQETKEEQKLDEFILKPGTRIKIRMGYSSDPELLELVFTGMVAEVGGGDVITVVAQGYGVELLQRIEEAHVKVPVAATFKHLDKLITRPDVLHFGKWQLAPRLDSHQKILGMHKTLNEETGVYEHPSWWRNIGGVRHILEFRDNEADDNIWVPEQSWWHNFMHGGSQNFVTKNRTIWDIFQEISRRMPGYIATVLPFDDRATIYFGPADFAYWYTNRNYTERSKVERLLDDKTDEEKVFSYKKIVSDDIRKAKVNDEINEIQVSLDKSASYINGLSNTERVKDKDVKNLLSSIKYNQFTTVIKSTPADPFDINKAINFMSTTVDGTLKRGGNKFQSEMASCLKVLKYELSSIQEKVAGDPDERPRASIEAKGEPGNISFKYTGEGSEYYVIDNEVVHGGELVERYNATRSHMLGYGHPNRKLVRNYHYKDSYHHIIANNVIASENNMCNKVTVEYGKEKYWVQRELRNSTTASSRVSCQADDDIWPEKIKERIVPERNARDIITAWLYGLGNLWLGMREMYGGHLTMLGDSTIKPYDIIFMSDYYTNMHGPVEVEQVTHHFSPETGFVTTVVPDLLCYVNNIMQTGTSLIAGAYMDEYSSFVMRASQSAGAGRFFGVGKKVANLLFKLGNLNVKYREPISFSPLLYADRPYIAGIEGFNKNSLGSSVLGRISSVMDLYFRKTPEHIDAYANIFFNKFYTRGKM